MIARCLRLASFSESAEGTLRTFLCPAMRECYLEIAGWLKPLGVESRIDAAGNLRGVYAAEEPGAPRLLIGSHLDTVPDAGAYDGILGVVLAIALLEELQGRRLPFAIEVLGFSEEEGVRFGTPFIGSRALVGRLDDPLLETRDPHGISVRSAIEQFGLSPQEIPQAQVGSDTLGYIEFHIEQGPVLDQLKQPLATVEAIAGQSRLEFTFSGRANHAGTTPMHLRRDALAGAAEWIETVERVARAVKGLVATVGKIEAVPGAANVIAGEVRLTLDVRHASAEIRSHAVSELIARAREIAVPRELSVQETAVMDQPAVELDLFLRQEIEKAIRKTGCSAPPMVSGAGHDAMILAERIPAAMVFLRSPGGISHHPDESVVAGDVEKAIQCGLNLLDQLAASPHFCKSLNSTRG